MKFLSLLAEVPAEAKGVAGVIASVSLPGWASVVASVATTIYMLRKTYMLRAPIPANSAEASEI